MKFSSSNIKLILRRRLRLSLADVNAKAEAYSKYGSIAVIDMFSRLNEKVLPDMAKYIAEPMSKIGNMTVYGTNGSGIKQTRDIVKDATGVDIMKANTIDAKVNVNGDVAM